MNARTSSANFEARKLPPDVASQTATLQDMANLADAITPALQKAEATIFEQQARIAELEGNLADFADELLRGLEVDNFEQPQQQSINISVINGPQMSPGGGGVVSAQIAELKRAMMLPVVDLYDAKGNVIGARRVDPDAEGNGASR